MTHISITQTYGVPVVIMVSTAGFVGNAFLTPDQVRKAFPTKPAKVTTVTIGTPYVCVNGNMGHGFFAVLFYLGPSCHSHAFQGSF